MAKTRQYARPPHLTDGWVATHVAPDGARFRARRGSQPTVTSSTCVATPGPQERV